MRIFDRLEQLAALGDRIGYSAAEDAAHELAAGWFRDAGLEVEVDPAGNLIGRRSGRTSDRSGRDRISTRSRTQAASTERSASSPGSRRSRLSACPALAVVVFRDEERGCAGSRACVAAGTLPDAYVELHIEQGPTLLRRRRAARRRDGDRRLRARPAQLHRHRGTRGNDADGRPRGRSRCRRPSSCSGPETSRAGSTEPSRQSGGSRSSRVATNVIPGFVGLTVDARAPDGERLDRLTEALEIEAPIRTEPAPMSEEIRAALCAELERLGLPVRRASRRAPATTPASSRTPACRRGCSSSAA